MASLAGTDIIRLFPLGSVVLFPTLRVPLFIFEPRYREMTRDALAGDGRIGMIAVLPQAAADMRGDPPLFDVGCEGAISHCAERADGSFNVILRATRRFRVEQELPRPDGQLYRSAQVEGLDDAYPSAERGRVEAVRRDVTLLLERLLGNASEPERMRAQLEQLRAIDDVRFVNALSQLLDFDVREKQRLLEASDVPEHYDILRDLMRFRLAEQREGGASGSGFLQ